MLPREQLQKYLVRALTGVGERVQGSDISPQALEQTGEQVASLAGAFLFIRCIVRSFYIFFIVLDCALFLCRCGVTDVQAEGAAVHASRSGTMHAWCLRGRFECSGDAGDQVGVELHSKEPQEHSGMKISLVCS